MKDKFWFGALVILAISLAEFPIKLFWSFSGQTIAIFMAFCSLFFGTRDLKNRIYVPILLLLGLTMVPYVVQPEALKSSNFIGFNPWNRLVMVSAFAVFSIAKLNNRVICQIYGALAVACLWITVVGWYRYLTKSGGLPSEHALNYWGVRYDIATRNADVLYVMIALWFETALSMTLLRWAIFVVCLPAVLLTYARSAWIALLAFFVRRKQIVPLIGGAIILAVTVIATGNGNSLYSRLISVFVADGRTASNGERINLALFSLSRITIFGRGPGQFMASDVQSGFSILKHPENFILLMASEMGILALIAFMTVWIWVLRRSPLRRMGLSMSIYLMLNSELDNIVIWLLMGLLFHTAMNAAERLPAIERSSHSRPRELWSGARSEA